MESYLTKIHEARFSERVPLTSTHLNGLGTAEVNERLNAIQPFSQGEYAYLAKSMTRHPDVGRRIQRRRYNEGLGLHDEVF